MRSNPETDALPEKSARVRLSWKPSSTFFQRRPPVPWTPESYLTQDEYDRLDDEDKTLHDFAMAAKSNDWDTTTRLLREIEIPAEALMAVKRVSGAQRIRDLGVKTHTAEAKYGKNWLE